VFVGVCEWVDACVSLCERVSVCESISVSVIVQSVCDREIWCEFV